MNAEYFRNHVSGVEIIPANPHEHGTAANDSPIGIVGSAELFVRIDDYNMKIRFMLARDLRYQAILGLDFIDNHVEDLIPGKQTLVMRGGSTVRYQRRLVTNLSSPALCC